MNLLGKSPQELRDAMQTMGEPAYRGAQIYHALYAERRFQFGAMTNLPLAFRERLAHEAAIELPRILRTYRSDDGTVRYVLSLGTGATESGERNTKPATIETVFFPEENRQTICISTQAGCAVDCHFCLTATLGLIRNLTAGEMIGQVLVALEATAAESGGRNAKPATIETVFMPEENRQTICISTQAGCAVDCHFCLTATLGLIRNLSAGEIIGQVLVALEDNRVALKPQTNVVLMGQGEPLLNYEAVIAALRILLDPNGMAISPKHTTLSTSGIIPGIEKLGLEKVRPKLAISLNASSNEQRDKIMPINQKYPIEKLIEACERYPLRPWEHLTFEYVLLGGFNDSAQDARRVARLLANLRAKVNLIPWNPGELPFEKPDPSRIEEFRRILADKDVRAFVRYSRGQDVMAACGQLALLESAGGPGSSTLSQISPTNV